MEEEEERMEMSSYEELTMFQAPCWEFPHCVMSFSKYFIHSFIFKVVILIF